jgi:hypothetical protein
MPKDEFDFEDPFELNGVGLMCNEDTTEAMTECFVEEFMRLGYNHKQIFAMFRNPHYIGMNMALEKRGEQFVRDTIAEVFARWGRTVAWAEQSRTGVPPVSDSLKAQPLLATPNDGDRRDAYPTLTDPLGAPIPDLTI